MKRALQLLACAVVVAVLGCFVWSTLFESRMLNVSSKTALVEMHSRIQLGDSEAGVHALVDDLKTDRTMLRTNLFLDTWEVSMPLELGLLPERRNCAASLRRGGAGGHSRAVDSKNTRHPPPPRLTCCHDNKVYLLAGG